VLTLKLIVSYDGTSFVGWQRQAEGHSIQGALEEAFERLDGRAVTVVGAGRTDAGVHAAGQVASVVLETPRDPAEVLRAANAMLPSAIRVLGVEPAADDFHARHASRAKTYCYRIVNGPIASPFTARYAWHVPWALDADAMDVAARQLEGEHDFAAFQSTGSDVRDTVRRLFESRVRVLPLDSADPGSPGTSPHAPLGDGRMIVYLVRGSGFLRHMVRAIVGTLVEIGSGRTDAQAMGRLIAGGARREAGATAPAHGLCLVRVEY
jgi:tRNA pseudouridine38-40 synthase